MRKQRNIVRFIVLMLTPVVLWSANILPIHSSQSAQAASDASRTKPNDQPALRAVANGKIAFGRDGEIFTMNSDGSDLKQLTSGGGFSASWSPDGMTIAFQRNVRLTSAVCVMDADGSNPRVLIIGYTYPKAWSPDGSKLLVSKFGARGVWAVNADGRNLIKVYEPAPKNN